MRIHVTNWKIEDVEGGESVFNCDPPGEIISTFVVHTKTGDWLRIVSSERS